MQIKPGLSEKQKQNSVAMNFTLIPVYSAPFLPLGYITLSIEYIWLTTGSANQKILCKIPNAPHCILTFILWSDSITWVRQNRFAAGLT